MKHYSGNTIRASSSDQFSIDKTLFPMGFLCFWSEMEPMNTIRATMSKSWAARQGKHYLGKHYLGNEVEVVAGPPG